MTETASLTSRLFDTVTGRSCLMDQSMPVLMIVVSAFALVLLMTIVAVVDRRRAMSQVPEGPMRGAAAVRFVLYTAGSAALFILYGRTLAAVC